VEFIFGGVEIFFNSKELSYRMVFYRGNIFQSIRLLTKGLDFMKDIRLISLPRGEIELFARS